VLSIIALIFIPLAVAAFWSRNAYRRLSQDPLLGKSALLVRVFIFSRLIYWFAFGLLLTAFLLAFAFSGLSGEGTRALLLLPDSRYPVSGWMKPIAEVIEFWRFPIVIVSLFGILTSVAALFLIGRGALKQIPENESPNVEFLRARARFFFLGLSLMAPPLILSLFFSF
jgi:hypothetical protein